jgi:PAS domain-containing protein
MTFAARCCTPTAQRSACSASSPPTSRYVVLHPDGSPVSPDQLPGRKAMLGQDAEPLLVRWFTHGSTPRWSVIKASPLRDGDGSVTGAVNVMEDVTEV